jgi:hypothetical protein
MVLCVIVNLALVVFRKAPALKRAVLPLMTEA